MKRAAWVIVLVGLVGIVIYFGRDLPLRAQVERVAEGLRSAGPGWFFAVMALVPLPLAWFTVPAGEAFAGQMTLGGVVVAALAAAAVQLALSYGVARYALRPGIERLVRRRGMVVPRVTPENALSVALLVRLTPGPPMILGSCVLAVAELPFRLYFLVSWLVTVPWVVGGVVLGRGILNGNVTLAAAGIGVLCAGIFATRWLRGRNLR